MKKTLVYLLVSLVVLMFTVGEALAGWWSCPATGKVTQASSGSGHSKNKGCDIQDKSKPMVGAARDGKVIRARRQSGYGRTVDIEHGSGNSKRVTRYAHLASFSVKKNQQVTEDQDVGQMGNDGTTAIHLPWEVRPAYTTEKEAFAKNIYSINLTKGQKVNRRDRVSAND